MTRPDHQQPARRALRLLWVLQGNAFDGLRLKQVAQAMQVAPPMALRDLARACPTTHPSSASPAAMAPRPARSPAA